MAISSYEIIIKATTSRLSGEKYPQGEGGGLVILDFGLPIAD